MPSQAMPQVRLFLVVVSTGSSLGNDRQQLLECSALELPFPSMTKPATTMPSGSYPSESRSSTSTVLGRSSPCLYWALRNRLTFSRKLLEFKTLISSEDSEKAHSSVNCAVRVACRSKKNSVKLCRHDWETADPETVMKVKTHGNASTLPSDPDIFTTLKLGDYLVIADTVEIHLGAVKVITRTLENTQDVDDAPLWLFNVVEGKGAVFPTSQSDLHPIEECVLKGALSWAQLPRGARMEIMRTAWWMRKSSLRTASTRPKRPIIAGGVSRNPACEGPEQASDPASEHDAEAGLSDLDAATPSPSNGNSQLVLRDAAGGGGWRRDCRPASPPASGAPPRPRGRPRRTGRTAFCAAPSSAARAPRRPTRGGSRPRWPTARPTTSGSTTPWRHSRTARRCSARATSSTPRGRPRIWARSSSAARPSPAGRPLAESEAARRRRRPRGGSRPRVPPRAASLPPPPSAPQPRPTRTNPRKFSFSTSEEWKGEGWAATKV